MKAPLQVIDIFEDTPRTCSPGEVLHEIFETQAAARPQAVAVVFTEAEAQEVPRRRERAEIRLAG